MGYGNYADALGFLTPNLTSNPIDTAGSYYANTLTGGIYSNSETLLGANPNYSNNLPNTVGSTYGTSWLNGLSQLGNSLAQGTSQLTGALTPALQGLETAGEQLGLVSPTGLLPYGQSSTSTSSSSLLLIGGAVLLVILLVKK